MIPGILAGNATVPIAFAFVVGNAFVNTAWNGTGSFKPAFFAAFFISVGERAISRARSRRRFSDSRSSICFRKREFLILKSIEEKCCRPAKKKPAPIRRPDKRVRAQIRQRLGCPFFATCGLRFVVLLFFIRFPPISKTVP